MNNEVMIVVDILCETQHYNTVLNAIYKCASESVLEDGCERYDVYPDTNGSQKITLVEMWRDIDSLGQHKGLPHYLQLQASLEDRVLSVDIQTARVF
ncbi:putative quinol monooxygenase [Pseudoalteromonas sp. SG45-1]|uniref:putative quinol monooxygenase n=1 Tax=Pseudoalteromonas sp. SG45-1 TaxID=2760957 RepID=UPI0015FF3E18|nr:antibiotic biosynthesis monooxygenase [Pseudoalteromonas sp. SG45-1]MBB1403059.1 antibiotic biosynthesis monooxygenase [Pseudoalteromonas sp. SG45-1]